jgi:hypothetical protein
MRDPYLEEVKRRRERCLAAIREIPIAALIWGPAPSADSIVAQARIVLRDELRRNGHVAHFSEELFENDAPYSIQAQQAADVEAHDVVFSIPASPGSIAEAHDFFKLPGISRKVITFLDDRWSDGYASKSLVDLRSVATGDVVIYDGGDLPGCIVDRAMDVVRRLQELQYLLGRRV